MPGDMAEAGGAYHAAPRFEPGTGERPRRFVVWTLLGLAVALIAAAAFNLVVDPYGTAGTGIFPVGLPRDASLKADLIERLDRQPETIVLGSSRSLKVDPRRISADTGRTAFNAGVRGGGPLEAYALLRWLHDRFPNDRPRVVWMLDLEAFRTDTVQPDLLSDPRIGRYVSQAHGLRSDGLDPWRLFSWSETEDSLRLVRSELDGELARRRRAQSARNGGFRADGYYTRRDFFWKLTFDEYTNLYRRGFSIRPLPWLYLKRTLALANSWGVRPLLVISPMHSRLLATVRQLGWDERHAELLAKLTALSRSRRFDIADMSSVAAFGGIPGAFYDPLHMRPANADRLVDVLAALYPSDM
jgi:hypothetical protein